MPQHLHSGQVYVLLISLLAVLSTATAPPLAGVEMCASQVGGGIIVGGILLTVSASLAVRQEGLARRDVDANPDLPHDGVNSIHVTSEFVVSVETLGVVSAELAEHPLGMRGSNKGGFGNSCHLLRGTVLG